MKFPRKGTPERRGREELRTRDLMNVALHHIFTFSRESFAEVAALSSQSLLLERLVYNIC